LKTRDEDRKEKFCPNFGLNLSAFAYFLYFFIKIRAPSS
jgi:hypothetical protein